MLRAYRRPLFMAAMSLMLALSLTRATAVQAAIPDPGAKPGPRGMYLTPCGKRADLVKALREQFGESPNGQGLSNTGVTAKVFLGPQGSWTIVATTPTGKSCLIGAGQS